MKKQPVLIFLWNKSEREKYLHFGLLLFFCLCHFFALSENGKGYPYNTLFQENSEHYSKVSGDSLFKQINPLIKKGNFTQAETIAERCLNIYKSLDDKKGEGNCLNKIATISYYIADYPRALEFYDKSIEEYRVVDFKEGIASSINNKGAIYYHLGNYPKALDHYKQAISLNEVVGNKQQKAAALENIGGIYFKLEEYALAMTYFETARKTYVGLKNKKALSLVLNSIGEIHLKQKNFVEASKSINEGLSLAQEIQDRQRIMESTYLIGTIKEITNKNKEALEIYIRAYKEAQRLANERYQALVLIAMGRTYLTLDNTELSISSCSKGLQIAKELNIISVQKEACSCLYSVNKSIQNQRRALYYYEQSMLLADSLQTKKMVDRMLNMEFEKEQLRDSIVHVEKERKIALVHQEVVEKKEKQRNVLFISAGFILVIAGGLWSRLKFTKKSKAKLQIEKDRSEHLLLNILPEEIAEELKAKGYVDAQDFDTATILFTDFKSFTETASQLTPQELVEEINVCFKAFDTIMETYDIEKIKTIGDAYMAAGGLPQPNARAVKNTVLAALDMQTFITKRKKDNTLLSKPAFEMRVGLHVGPIVAGIVGIKKFQYDIWGDTVNTASRMESNGEVGKVNISEDTYALVKNETDLVFEYRGKISAKGKGELAMYFVSSKSVSEVNSPCQTELVEVSK